MKTKLILTFITLCLATIVCPQHSYAIMSNASLIGTYKIGGLDSTLSKPNTLPVRSIIGGNNISVIFDGNGNCSASSDWMQFEETYDKPSLQSAYFDKVNVTSGPIPPDPPSSCTYTVGSTGDAIITFGVNEVISGWQASADGNTLLRLTTSPNSKGDGAYKTEILIGVKVGTNMPASLSGTYKIGGLDSTLSKPAMSVSSIVGGNNISVTFYVDGTCSATSSWMQFEEQYANNSAVYNYINTTSGTDYPTTCTYAVDPSSGVVAITLDGGTISGWQVSADGNTLLRLTTSPNSKGDGAYKTEILVGVKVGTNMPTSLSGTYKIGGLDSTLSKPNTLPVRSIMGGNNISVIFNSNNTCSASSDWMQFEEEYVNPSVQSAYFDKVNVTSGTDTPPSCTYSVGSTGDAVITLGGGTEVISGWQISADGNTLVRLATSQQSSLTGTDYKTQIMVGAKIDWPTPGFIIASPSSVNFGNVTVGSSATPVQLTITNSGSGPLTVNSKNKIGNFPEIDINFGGSNACSNIPLNAGSSCTLLATFNPTSTGSKFATLTINSTAINPVYSITLTGTGVTVPGAPTINSVTPWDGEATVNFSAPNNDGASPILGYTVTTNPAVTPVSGTAPSITITGLTNSQLYTVSVAAFNAVGTGPAASSTTTPYFAPFRIGSTGYSDLSIALGVVAPNAEIKAQIGTVTIASPSLILTQGVIFSGGYPPTDYTTATGFTTIAGRVDIKSSNGKVVFNNIKVM